MTAAMMIPPYAQPVAEALEALDILRRRLAAVEAKEAAADAQIAPLTAALGDALADGDVIVDHGPIETAERVSRRAKAEAAGLRRKIAEQRAAIGRLDQAASAGLQATYADAMKRINSRFVAERKKLMATVAEAMGLAYAARDDAMAFAIGQVKLPATLDDAPAVLSWPGIGDLQGDIPPTENDAAQQLAMAAFIFQKARTAAREGLQAQA